MVTEITIRAISLGTHRELDTDETKLGAERAAELVGRTYGSKDAPLADQITKMVLHDGNSDGSVGFADRKVGSEYVQVDGRNATVDGGTLYWGKVTYMDGSSASRVPLRILQGGNGNLYMAPPPSDAPRSEIDAVTQKPIASIQITEVKQNNFNALSSDRYGLADAPVFLCFRDGTRIATAGGDVAVEDLRPGDLVMTRDNGLQPLRWIGVKPVAGAVLAAFPNLRPVCIRAGALGAGLPMRDLHVSPQHRILVRSKIAERMFGQPEVLVAAKCLIGLPGIQVDESDRDLVYIHILFDRNEIVLSEGAETESLFTGPTALKAVSPEARAELLALFPALVRPDHMPEPARQLGTTRQGRQLAQRHKANGRDLQATG